MKDTKGHTFSPKNYKKTDKKISYPLENGKNLNPGQNQYTIVGSIKGKTYTIANIDLYVLATSEKPQEATSDRKIKVVYYNNLESNFAIKQFRKLLENAKILESYGLDILHVSSGVPNPEYKRQVKINNFPEDFPLDWIIYMGTEIKKHVKIPVIGVSKIKKESQASWLVENNLLDFVAVGKAMISQDKWMENARKDFMSKNRH